jgi:hypothetical protein
MPKGRPGHLASGGSRTVPFAPQRVKDAAQRLKDGGKSGRRTRRTSGS